MPVRVQLRRTRGWRMPPGTVKVDRSTPYGNPYEIRERKRGGRRRFWVYRDGRAFTGSLTHREAAEKSVELFRHGVAPLLDLSPLRGRNLGCWCHPDAPCHVDVLLELANADGD